jgi:hypothetical protein
MLLVRAHLEVIGKGSGFVRSTDWNLQEFEVVALAITGFEGDLVIIIKSTIFGVVNLVEGGSAGPVVKSSISKLYFEQGYFMGLDCNWILGYHTN